MRVNALHEHAGLVILNLYGTQVTDEVLLQLKGMTRLNNLQLGKTKVTGTGLKHLKDLTQSCGALHFMKRPSRMRD